ncbi:MAG TPA: alkaline phosphatase D family protein, partial [Bordetella sp.]
MSMDRRNFLKWSSFLTVSVATTGLAGCNDDDNGNNGGGNNGGNGGGPGGDATAYSYPQGVASGDPRPDSIVLWTRVQGGSASSIPVTVQVATDTAFKQLLVNASISATSDWDYTIRHKVTGLSPATTYYYRFLSGSATSTTGRTRTAPAAGTPVSQMKFAFITCQDWSVNHWAAFTDLAAIDDLDFVVHLGDYIYETTEGTGPSPVESAHAPVTLPSGGVATPNDSTGTPSASNLYANTLPDYRALYRQYRTDPRLQKLHALFPFIAIWDDHEFSDDCWQDYDTYGVTPNSEQLGRRRSASQAWFEYMPADVTIDLANPSFQNITIYRSFQFGNLATLVMTDERLNRVQHLVSQVAPAGSGFVGTRYFVQQTQLQAAEAGLMAAAGGALAPVSMLGDTQRNWWKQQMSAATTTWKLWGNEVSLLRMGLDGTQAVAGLLFQGLLAAQPSLAPVLAPSQGPIMVALVTDLATGGTTTPFTQTIAALTTVLTPVLGGPTAAGTAAAIAASFTSTLASIPATLLNKYILDTDQWDGYNAERKDLMSYLQTNSIGNVVAITGDIHAFFAGPVMADYDAATPVPVMVDLVTAGISSDSLFSFYKDAVDTTPGFAAAAALIYTQDATTGAVTNTFNNTLTTFNPWLAGGTGYVDTDAQGYAVVTLTP